MKHLKEFTGLNRTIILSPKDTFCVKWKRSHLVTEPSMFDENKRLPSGPPGHQISDVTLPLGFPCIVCKRQKSNESEREQQGNDVVKEKVEE